MEGRLPAPPRPVMLRMPFGMDGDLPPRGIEYRQRVPGPDAGYYPDQNPHIQNPMEKTQPPFRDPFGQQRPPMFQVVRVQRGSTHMLYFIASQRWAFA